MLVRHLVCFCALFLFAGDAAAGSTTGTSQISPLASDQLAASLQKAANDPESPFYLQVNCTDQKGIRSLELFSGGAAIWNRRSQIMLSAPARSALLKTLIERGFPTFEDSYGGRERPEKTKAAARISCRIRVEIDNLRKSSVQQAGGEQSKQLTGLAAELLDQVEKFTDSALIPENLQDALDKLSEGQLAPQCLRLRFVDLPARDNNAPGSILRLIGGEISRQAYIPGQVVAEPVSESLGQEQYVKLLAGLQKAQLPSIPGNLWSDDQLEFEVQVLGFKKVVLARRFTRFDAKANEPAQQRFDALLLVLRELNQ